MPTSSQKTRSQTSRALHVDKRWYINGRTHLHQTPPSSHQPPMRKRNIYLNITPPHGNGEQGARAASKKYYLNDGARSKRLSEGGDFFEAGAAHPCRLMNRTPVNLRCV